MPYISDDHSRLGDPSQYAKGFVKVCDEKLWGKQYADQFAVNEVKEDRAEYDHLVETAGVDDLRAYWLGCRDACDIFLRISKEQGCE